MKELSSTIIIGIVDIGKYHHMHNKVYFYDKEFENSVKYSTHDTKVFTSRGVMNLYLTPYFYHKKINFYYIPFEDWLSMSKLNSKDIEAFSLLISMIENYPRTN